MSEPALYIMARQPVAGQTKTRLQPVLGEKGTALLTAWMIRETVQLARASWQGPVVLMAWPDTSHPLFPALARTHDVALDVQVPGDLGQKMFAALAAGIARHGAAAVMGIDVPHCPRSVLQRASATLAAGQSVIGPSHDGGYYLLGLTQALPSIFTDMPWGSDAIYGETVKRASQAGIDLQPLEALTDVDTPQDLHAVANTYAPLEKLVRQLSGEALPKR